MKHRFKRKHHSSSREDEEGNADDKEEALGEDRGESDGMNTKRQSLFPEKHITSEERESDVQPEVAGCRDVLMTEPLEKQEAGPKASNFSPHAGPSVHFLGGPSPLFCEIFSRLIPLQNLASYSPWLHSYTTWDYEQ